MSDAIGWEHAVKELQGENERLRAEVEGLKGELHPAASLRKRLLGDVVAQLIDQPSAVRDPRHEACELALSALRTEKADLRARLEAAERVIASAREHMLIDATPDDEMPARILRAYAERDASSVFESFPPETAQKLNAWREQRYAILERAVHTLDAARAPSDEHDSSPSSSAPGENEPHPHTGRPVQTAQPAGCMATGADDEGQGEEAGE